MRKQILSIIAIIVICFTALPLLCASAVTPLDTEKELGYYMIMSGDRLMLV